MKRKYKPEGYKCPVCGATFRRPQSLGGHVTHAHRDVDLDRIIEMKKQLKERKR